MRWLLWGRYVVLISMIAVVAAIGWTAWKTRS
jgi:hypothetical protein